MILYCHTKHDRPALFGLGGVFQALGRRRARGPLTSQDFVLKQLPFLGFLVRLKNTLVNSPFSHSATTFALTSSCNRIRSSRSSPEHTHYLILQRMSIKIFWFYINRSPSNCSSHRWLNEVPVPDAVYGSAPVGILTYSKSGYMSATITSTDAEDRPANLTFPFRDGQTDADVCIHTDSSP